MAHATDQRTNTSKHKKTQKTKQNKITVGENHGNIHLFPALNKADLIQLKIFYF